MPERRRSYEVKTCSSENGLHACLSSCLPGGNLLVQPHSKFPSRCTSQNKPFLPQKNLKVRDFSGALASQSQPWMRRGKNLDRKNLFLLFFGKKRDVVRPNMALRANPCLWREWETRQSSSDISSRRLETRSARSKKSAAWNPLGTANIFFPALAHLLTLSEFLLLHHEAKKIVIMSWHSIE